MEVGDVVVWVRSKLNEGEGVWRRKENGILGRVILSVVEVNFCLVEIERIWLKCYFWIGIVWIWEMFDVFWWLYNYIVMDRNDLVWRSRSDWRRGCKYFSILIVLWIWFIVIRCYCIWIFCWGICLLNILLFFL